MASSEGKPVIIPDVNILVHAHRREGTQHDICKAVFDRALIDGDAILLATATVNGFLRLVTHPTVFKSPTPLDLALATIDHWLRLPGAGWAAPGGKHWNILRDLCQRHHAQGNAIYDLHLAALAMEHRAELWSLDEDFSRIAGLRWRKPS